MSTTQPRFEVATDCGTTKGFDTRSEAEEGKQTHISLCDDCDESDVSINAVDNRPVNDSESVEEDTPEVIEAPESDSEPGDSRVTGSAYDDLPDEKPGIEDDPIDWMPSHFVDEIQGVPTLNRKGYAVMAERFNVSVTSEPVVRASETDFEYAEFRATAVTKSGVEYSGFGSAHVDRNTGDGGDDKYLLNELAQTRAMKRAASWALGLGMTAKEEMEGSL